jgi:tetratricopeptide (TPR) repeat protein
MRWWLPAGLALTVAAAALWSIVRTRSQAPPEIDGDRLSPPARQSLAEARAAVLREPASGRAWGRLGMTCMAHDYAPEALVCFAEAARRQPTQFRWLYLSGILREEVDPLRAAADYDAAIAINKAPHGPLHWRRGDLSLRLDQLEIAEREFLVATRIDQGSPYPLVGLARVALGRGDLAEAQTRLEAAAEKAPWSRDVLNERARLLRRQGAESAAWDVQQQASRLPPAPREMPDPIRQEVYQHGEPARALALRADQAAAQGDLGQAVRWVRQLIAESPELSRPRINAGQLLLALGDRDAAQIILQDAVERFPGEALAHYGLAGVCEARGEADAAIREYGLACDLKPDYAEASYRLGLLLWRQKDLAGAASALKRTIAVAPGLAAAHLTLGRVLRDQGDLDQALVEVRRTIRLAPHESEAARVLEELSAALTERKEGTTSPD